jgi:hypothetical protein
MWKISGFCSIWRIADCVKEMMESWMKIGIFIALSTDSQWHQLSNDVAQAPHGQ